MSPSRQSPGLETATHFTPRFDANGLLTAVVTDAATGHVLMVAHMNAEAIARTIETGEAHFWSRSRARLWRKGETSGNTLRVLEMRTDCDQDALWIMARLEGSSACHTGEYSCFYRIVATPEANNTESPALHIMPLAPN